MSKPPLQNPERTDAGERPSGLLPQTVSPAEQAERARSLFEYHPDAVYSLDLQGNFTSINPAGAALCGFSREEALTMSFVPMILPEDLPRTLIHFERACHGEAQRYEIGFRRRGGDCRDLRVTNVPIMVEGTVVGVYGIAQDITALKQAERARREAEERLERLAYYDELTGLPNSLLLRERLGDLLPTHFQSLVGLVYLDLDRFKVANDSLGHDFGDALLRAAAERITAALRPGEMAARIGSDEMAVLLPELDAPEDAVEAAQRFRAAVRGPVAFGGRDAFLTASVGIAVSDQIEDVDQTAGLLRAADMALAQAKACGRDSAKGYSPVLLTAARERLEMEGELRRALANSLSERTPPYPNAGRLILHYQPVLRLADGAVESLEALSRWEHPARGLVPPDRFIGLAEETGLIQPLGLWALGEATRQTWAWRQIVPGMEKLGIAVNLSARQFEQPELTQEIARLLEASGLPPEALTLEVTESVMMENSDQGVAGRLDALKKLGVYLAADDFGTGYSSLSYLAQLPLDTLKIDRSFIRRLDESVKAEGVVRAILGLARALGLKVTAEGVETLQQRELLRSMGCHRVQGYLISRPLCAEAMTTFLRGQRPPLRRAA